MKTVTFLTVVTLASTFAAPGKSSKDKENKEQLTQVSRIYVAGRDAASVKVRDRISRANACFALADSADSSDAVLTVTSPEAAGLLAMGPAGSVTGELTKDGSKIWNNESPLPTLQNRNASVDLALVSLVNLLEHDAGCGKKKGALAEGRK